MSLKKKITIVSNLTTFLAIPAGVVALGMLGLSLHYHPLPPTKALSLLAAIVASLILPVTTIWMLKFQIIHNGWLKNTLIFLLFAYGGFLALYMGRQVIIDSGDLIIWFPLFLYGVLIVLAAFLFTKLKDS